MNEKKRLEFQQKLIQKQSEQIESLKAQIEKQKLELEEKDRIINSVESLRNELSQSVARHENAEKEFRKLTDEVRKMKEIFNKEVFKGRWNLIKFLIK